MNITINKEFFFHKQIKTAIFLLYVVCLFFKNSKNQEFSFLYKNPELHCRNIEEWGAWMKGERELENECETEI